MGTSKKAEIQVKFLDSKTGNPLGSGQDEYQSVIGEASQEESLLDFFVKRSVPINHSCGGMGTCGTCLIEVENEELLQEPNEIEMELKRDRGLDRHERLACQNYPINKLKIRIRI